MANVHQTIMDNIATKIATISVVNGYHTDLGAGVDVDRPDEQEQTAAWLVNIIDVSEYPLEESQGINTKEDHRLTVDVEITRQQITDAVDQEIRKAISDVRKAFSAYRNLSVTDNTIIVNHGGWEKSRNELGEVLVGRVVFHLIIDYRTQSFLETL